MVQRALSASRDKVGSGPCAQEVINALLFMMANALPVAMVIGLQVEEDSPIPENHIALFRDGDMTGRIVTASLVKFCIQILLSIDPSKLGGKLSCDGHMLLEGRMSCDSHMLFILLPPWSSSPEGTVRESNVLPLP